MNKLLKWGIIISLSALVIWFLNSYRKCRKEGKKRGGLFECNPFDSEPTYLIAEEVRYQTREGKCYEITDYGKKMSFREVDAENCN